MKVLKYVLIVLIAATGCKTSKSDLDEWAEEGKIKNIEKFVIKKLESEEASKSVSHGIKLIANNKADSSLKRILRSIKREVKNNALKKVVRSTSKRNIEAHKPRKFCSLLAKNNIENYGNSARLISEYSRKGIIKCVVNFAENIDLTKKKGKLIDLINKIKMSESELPKELTYLKDNIVRIEDNLDKIEKLEEKRKNKKIELREVKRNKEKVKGLVKDAKYLRGYVVGLVEEVNGRYGYEFAPLNEYGRPTSDRGYIITEERKFDSKGKFEIGVKKVNEVETKIKEKYGGFEQSWPVYIEIENLSEKRKKLRKMKKRVRVLESNVKYYRDEKTRAEFEIEKSKESLWIVKNKFGKENENIIGAAPLNKGNVVYLKSVNQGDSIKAIFKYGKKDEKKLIKKHGDIFFCCFETSDDGTEVLYHTTGKKNTRYYKWDIESGKMNWLGRKFGNSNEYRKMSDTLSLSRYKDKYGSEVAKIPNLYRGMKYNTAKKILVTHGWKTVDNENPSFKKLESSEFEVDKDKQNELVRIHHRNNSTKVFESFSSHNLKINTIGGKKLIIENWNRSY